jgi:hypothetical protein
MRLACTLLHSLLSGDALGMQLGNWKSAGRTCVSSSPPSRRCRVTPSLPTTVRLARRKDGSDGPRESRTDDDAIPSEESGNPKPTRRSKEEEDAILGYAIDSFLRGGYNLQGSEESLARPTDLTPGATLSAALRSLRGHDLPSQTHGAAVFMRYCLPLRRSERWGDASSIGKDPWKEVLRGGLTASTLLRRIRASDFAGLLDWGSLDVTEGACTSDRDLVGLPSVAYVNAALFFEDESEPFILQFKLRRGGGGAWMIDTIRRSQNELFVER